MSLYNVIIFLSFILTYKDSATQPKRQIFFDLSLLSGKLVEAILGSKGLACGCGLAVAIDHTTHTCYRGEPLPSIKYQYINDKTMAFMAFSGP